MLGKYSSPMGASGIVQLVLLFLCTKPTWGVRCHDWGAPQKTDLLNTTPWVHHRRDSTGRLQGKFYLISGCEKGWRDKHSGWHGWAATDVVDLELLWNTGVVHNDRCLFGGGRPHCFFGAYCLQAVSFWGFGFKFSWCKIGTYFPWTNYQPKFSIWKNHANGEWSSFRFLYWLKS